MPADGVYAGLAGPRRRRAGCRRPSRSGPTRPSPAGSAGSRRTCSTSTATSTASGVALDFVAHLREQRRYDGVEPLVAQIRDGRRARPARPCPEPVVVPHAGSLVETSGHRRTASRACTTPRVRGSHANTPNSGRSWRSTKKHKSKITRGVRDRRGRHRFARGPGRDADQADRRPHRAPQGAQARPPQPSWSAAAGRPPPPAAQLPAEEGHHAATGRSSSGSACGADAERGSGRTVAPPLRVDTDDGASATALSGSPSAHRSSVVAPGPRITGPPGASIEDRPSEQLPARVERPHDRRSTAPHDRAEQLSATSTSTAVIDNGSFGTREITFSTGRLARQAAGSVHRPARRHRRALRDHRQQAARRSSSTSSR